MNSKAQRESKKGCQSQTYNQLSFDKPVNKMLTPHITKGNLPLQHTLDLIALCSDRQLNSKRHKYQQAAFQTYADIWTNRQTDTWSQLFKWMKDQQTDRKAAC